jgi:hypothetical protein
VDAFGSDAVVKVKLQHWRAFQRHFGWKTAPMLAICRFVAIAPQNAYSGLPKAISSPGGLLN